jgi:uncharacterized phage-associated protein
MRYFYENTNQSYLGKTKLMKLFYFADFSHLRKYGNPITYDRYFHFERGPVPGTILNLVNSVVDNEESAILADTIYIEKSPSSSMQKIKCHNNFSEEDENYFSENELKTLEEVCKVFSEKDTRYIVAASHNEDSWLKTKLAESIPYSLATSDPEIKNDIDFLQKVRVNNFNEY